MVLTAEGDLLLDDDNFESVKKKQMGTGESSRLSLGKDPPSKKELFLQFCFVSGRKLDV